MFLAPRRLSSKLVVVQFFTRTIFFLWWALVLPTAAAPGDGLAWRLELQLHLGRVAVRAQVGAVKLGIWRARRPPFARSAASRPAPAAVHPAADARQGRGPPWRGRPPGPASGCPGKRLSTNTQVAVGVLMGAVRGRGHGHRRRSLKLPPRSKLAAAIVARSPASGRCNPPRSKRSPRTPPRSSSSRPRRCLGRLISTRMLLSANLMPSPPRAASWASVGLPNSTKANLESALRSGWRHDLARRFLDIGRAF